MSATQAGNPFCVTQSYFPNPFYLASLAQAAAKSKEALEKRTIADAILRAKKETITLNLKISELHKKSILHIDNDTFPLKKLCTLPQMQVFGIESQDSIEFPTFQGQAHMLAVRVKTHVHTANDTTRVYARSIDGTIELIPRTLTPEELQARLSLQKV